LWTGLWTGVWTGVCVSLGSNYQHVMLPDWLIFVVREFRLSTRKSL